MLREDAYLRIARNQAVDQIGCNLALVMIYESEPSIGPRGRQTCNELNSDFAKSLFHLLHGREDSRDQLRLQGVSVDAERQIGKDALRVRLSLSFRNDAVAVGIDSCNDTGRHRDSRHQAHGKLNSISFYGDDRGLQILIYPMRRSRHHERQNDDDWKDLAHFAVNLRP